jgi:hypothetical protein
MEEQLIRPGPHGLAIREGFSGTVENACQHPYHIATYGCDCGIAYRIFANAVHYDFGQQFQNYVKNLHECICQNGGPHPDVIEIPMDAEL